MRKIKLIEIASARSGDKNDICNIGVLANSPANYELLAKHLTAEKVKAHFKGLIKGKVIRYEWPSMEALNFVCHEALDGGGEFDKYFLGNILGQVVVAHDAVGGPQDGLVMQIEEDFQCRQVPGLTLADCF